MTREPLSGREAGVANELDGAALRQPRLKSNRPIALRRVGTGRANRSHPKKQSKTQ